MAWTPIAESGISFTENMALGVSRVGSIFTTGPGVILQNGSWDIALASPYLLRATANEYFAELDEVASAYEGAILRVGDVVWNNQTWPPPVIGSFTPSPVEGTGTVVTYSPAMWGGSASDGDGDGGGKGGGLVGVPERFSFLVEIFVPEAVDTSIDCDEIGPATRVNVSAYRRAAEQVIRVMRGEKRCLVVNFRGIVREGRTIRRADFRVMHPFALALSNARISGLEAIVDMHAQGSGRGLMRCDVTLDNGEVYPVLFWVDVASAPWFEGETWNAQGPRTLSVVVP